MINIKSTKLYRKRATIKDVAIKTGLSQTTISRIINNHPYVSEEKKKLVEQVMNELGYVPNSAAQTLRNRKTNMIAVLVPRIANPFFSTLVEGIESIAYQKGYQLLIGQTHYSPEREMGFFDLINKKQVDGMILTSIENPWSTVEPYTRNSPVILCNEYDDEATIPMIRLNQIEGGYIGTKHLIEKGYKKVGYCSGGHSRLARDREKGFYKAMAEYGLEVNKDWIFYGAYTSEDGIQVIEKIIKMKDRPTAIFAGGDEAAAGMIKAARQHNLKIPEEIAIIGFDDQPIAKLVEPEMTTVKQPIVEIGQQAMDLMVKLLERSADSYEHDELSVALIERSTT